jgi:hypothetical protein
MRASIIVALVLLLVVTYVYTAPQQAMTHKFKPSSKLTVTKRTTEQIVKAALLQKKIQAKLDLCPTCVSIVGQTINQLLNIILSGGVIGTCGTLCALVAQEFPQSVQQVINAGCNLLCDYEGIEEFMALVEKADLDPIWLCEEAKFCPVHDCQIPVCATFKQLRTIPEKGRMGTTFQLVGVLQVLANQTSTGEQIVEIVTSTGDILGDGELVPGGWTAGIYDLNWEVQIKNDEQTQDDPFEPGLYQVGMEICEGQCGSRHSHTRTLAKVFGNFTVTD